MVLLDRLVTPRRFRPWHRGLLLSSPGQKIAHIGALRLLDVWHCRLFLSESVVTSICVIVSLLRLLLPLVFELIIVKVGALSLEL